MSRPLSVGSARRARARPARERVRMDDRLLVDVVHLERVAGRAVDQTALVKRPCGRCPRATRAACRPPPARSRAPSGSTESRAAQADAEPVEEAELDARDHVRRDVGKGVSAAKRARSRVACGRRRGREEVMAGILCPAPRGLPRVGFHDFLEEFAEQIADLLFRRPERGAAERCRAIHRRTCQSLPHDGDVQIALTSPSRAAWGKPCPG